MIPDADEPLAEVCTDLSVLERVTQTLRDQGYQVREAEPRWLAQNTVEVTELDQARMLLKLMDALEDLEDVQGVTANFDLDQHCATLVETT